MAAGGCQPEGHILQWVITGRGELHNLWAGQEEEAAAELTAALRRRLEGRAPFLWSDSVVIRTARPLPRLEELLEKPGLPRIGGSRRALYGPGLPGGTPCQPGTDLGSGARPRKHGSGPFYLDEETLAAIIDRARELILERLVAWGEER